ncbi:MAG: GNAT family N-acetyltransferase [Halioglobus sp.]
MSEPGPTVSESIQSERRRLLIDATITAISEYGLFKLTLAKIAKIAGLTAGSVNFHFDSKEALLLETLAFLTRELQESIDQALILAGEDPADKLLAIFDASLNPEITEPKKMAVWYAFSSEARAREDYQKICGEQDHKNFQITRHLCEQIISKGGKQESMSARAMANANQGLIDEIWQEILYAGENYDREDARHVYLSFLASVFPWCFEMPKAPSAAKNGLSRKEGTLTIARAGPEHLTVANELFDLYRQFRGKTANTKQSKRFLSKNMKQDNSAIFLAMNENDKAVGFMQLYTNRCSLETRSFLTLNDLYVDNHYRGRGIGHELLQQAKKYAKKLGACRIELDTAVDNFGAQSLFEELGYKKDLDFYQYSLEIS